MALTRMVDKIQQPSENSEPIAAPTMSSKGLNDQIVILNARIKEIQGLETIKLSLLPAIPTQKDIIEYNSQINALYRRIKKIEVSKQHKPKAAVDTIPPSIEVISPKSDTGIMKIAKYTTTVGGIASDDSGVAWVTVNGLNAALDGQGNFNREAYLKVGRNDIEIKAMDTRGNVGTKMVTIYREMTKEIAKIKKPLKQKLAPRDKVFGQRWAVVIGISEHSYSGQSGLMNLIFADDDAKAFARVLRNVGWSESHIKLLINEEAIKRNLEIALESWLTKAGPKDQIVLFWSGHGFPDPEDPEKVYFACYDTDISIPVTGYRMDKVRATLEERKARNVILFADTCHAGKLITRGDRGISIVPEIDKMRREKKVPKGWIFMVGADTDRQAIEHTSWTNGAFTHSLIKGLSGIADGYESAGPKDGIITMGELRAYLNSAMPDETQKVLGVAKRPVITTSTGDPDIWNLTLQAK